MTERRKAKLTARDADVLTWVGEVGAVTVGTELEPGLLGWLLGRAQERPVSARRVREWVRRMEAQGLLWSGEVAGARWCHLTLHGARTVGVAWHRYQLKAGVTKHMAGVGEVRFWLEGTTPGEWVPEPRPAGAAGPRRPDGGWLLPDGALAAVEVELTRKYAVAGFGPMGGSYPELVARMPPAVDEVWWFVPTLTDAGWLAGKLAGASLPCRVAVLPYLRQPALHPEGCRCLPCRQAPAVLRRPALRVVGGWQ
jgi:hypothetical protein